MESGVARRVTTATAAHGVTYPYQLGPQRARQATLTSYQPTAAQGEQPLEEIPPTFSFSPPCAPPPPATSIPGCMLTASTGGNSCAAMTLPEACNTSAQCFTVKQGCTSGSAIQCSTVAPTCSNTYSVQTCHGNYTASQDCANHTFFPGCYSVVPGNNPCISTGVNGNCPPTSTDGCQIWTYAAACSTNSNYCQALSVKPGAAGCTAVATGNCDATFANNSTCDNTTYSFSCMTTMSQNQQCTQAGGCLRTYAPGCMTSSSGGICGKTSAGGSNNACSTSVASPGGKNTCTAATGTGANSVCQAPTIAMSDNAAPMAAFTLFACILPLGGFPLLKIRRY